MDLLSTAAHAARCDVECSLDGLQSSDTMRMIGVQVISIVRCCVRGGSALMKGGGAQITDDSRVIDLDTDPNAHSCVLCPNSVGESKTSPICLKVGSASSLFSLSRKSVKPHLQNGSRMQRHSRSEMHTKYINSCEKKCGFEQDCGFGFHDSSRQRKRNAGGGGA